MPPTLAICSITVCPICSYSCFLFDASFFENRIDSPKETVTGNSLGHLAFIGRTLKVPEIYAGITWHCDSSTKYPIPGLPVCKYPSSVLVPSGKITTGVPAFKWSRAKPNALRSNRWVFRGIHPNLWRIQLNHRLGKRFARPKNTTRRRIAQPNNGISKKLA